MFEIKFSGSDFLCVRKEIQEFAINHLNMKFGVTLPAHVDAPTEAETAPELPSGAEPVVEKKKPGRPKGTTVAAKHGRPELAPEPRPKYEPPVEVAPPTYEPEPISAPAAVNETVAVAPQKFVIPTEEEAMSAIQKIQDKHGLEQAKKLIIDGILPKFGAKRGRDLKPEQRAAFIAACEQVL